MGFKELPLCCFWWWKPCLIQKTNTNNANLKLVKSFLYMIGKPTRLKFFVDTCTFVLIMFANINLTIRTWTSHYWFGNFLNCNINDNNNIKDYWWIDFAHGKKNTIWCVTCLILIIGNYDIIYIKIVLVVHVEKGLRKRWIECIYFIQIVHLICEYVTWC
jgi:hypothetical protein